jgi:hypothetical protein
VAEVAVNDGRSVVTLNHDRAGPGAVVLRLTAACDPARAVQAPAPAPGVRRYQRVGPRTGEFRATWYLTCDTIGGLEGWHLADVRVLWFGGAELCTNPGS